ncbi:hypothetical protein PIB30_008852 [Stylosanthes scabra]|uniref:Uncharacterized protein n=1 Tax=Stylosanthes scabra TaxID=79078 RepID=A0ABU6Y322_9FABA|nr:hypothetical protein [Stylosanthes scabra]
MSGEEHLVDDQTLPPVKGIWGNAMTSLCGRGRMQDVCPSKQWGRKTSGRDGVGACKGEKGWFMVGRLRGPSATGEGRSRGGVLTLG